MSTRSPLRSGSIFLFTLGLLLVMVALSYSFMASMRIRRDANENLNLLSLAEMTARQGASHAIEVLNQDYLSQPGVPTHLGLGYRTAFEPIDTFKVAKHLRSDTKANVLQYRPVGDPSTMEDENENDTKTESLMTAVYNYTYQAGGTYHHQPYIYGRGKLLTQGIGRYIEPGNYHTDLRSKPYSFHLAHPVAANASSSDPAVRRGEPWTANRYDPFYLDHNLEPTANQAEARYRFRYAIAIEDLSGHLPFSWQAPYADGRPDARSTTVSVVDTQATDEVNHVIGEKYGDSSYNMTAYFVGSGKSWAGWFFANGSGITTFTPATDTDHSLGKYNILAEFSGSTPKRWDDGAASIPATRPSLTAATGSRVWASNRGPLASSGNAKSFLGNLGNSSGNETPSLCYTITPYGRAPNVSTAPNAWNDSFTECPWHLNLPTAVPDAITAMLYAFMPEEYQWRRYTHRKIKEFNGFDGGGKPQWKNPTPPGPINETLVNITSLSLTRSPRNFINLIASPGFSPNFSHLPATQPYPGTDISSPGPGWNVNLGKDIDLNTTTFGAMAETSTGPVPASHDDVTPRPPFWGMGSAPTHQTYNEYDLISSYDSHVEKSEEYAGGERWSLFQPYSSGGFTDAGGFKYHDSYFLDLATAFCHTISVVQLAWLPDNGAGSDNFPFDGRVHYPNNVTTSALLPLLSDVTPPGRDFDVMDRDADGDGLYETPSAFDTIAEVDAQFVRNMGEYFGTTASPTTPEQGLYMVKLSPSTYYSSRYICPATLIAWAPSNNIASLLSKGLITSAQGEMMELFLNDMRMSFFGASPQYPDFKGIDFDNNGTVRCSGYSGGQAPVAADRFGPVCDPRDRFTLTGCFVLQKSHFFRVFVRGEVYDTIRRLPAESTTLEMVYALDPSGRIYDINNIPNPANYDPNGDGNTNDADIRDSSVLFQRFHWIKYQAYRPRSYP